ncbi:hypothetical protein BU26DRAFT_96622 [Trematosphaeria pertusa]|uniref:Uncharacterized protein n=1 Tax=Trematosphaeria pertusa TaxID=390896 RepID=A0A6A6I1Q0_9PLEO|nr:uncharacterized protein BU26DRAFT_96622 [Trematosphaeria pertusa]KAF2244251.1 hypothetical protein BU26DRAFT_96622 [Trematosphaeria pertusa]
METAFCGRSVGRLVLEACAAACEARAEHVPSFASEACACLSNDHCASERARDPDLLLHLLHCGSCHHCLFSSDVAPCAECGRAMVAWVLRVRTGPGSYFPLAKKSGSILLPRYLRAMQHTSDLAKIAGNEFAEKSKECISTA